MSSVKKMSNGGRDLFRGVILMDKWVDKLAWFTVILIFLVIIWFKYQLSVPK